MFPFQYSSQQRSASEAQHCQKNLSGNSGAKKKKEKTVQRRQRN